MFGSRKSDGNGTFGVAIALGAAATHTGFPVSSTLRLAQPLRVAEQLHRRDAIG